MAQPCGKGGGPRPPSGPPAEHASPHIPLSRPRPSCTRSTPPARDHLSAQAIAVDAPPAKTARPAPEVLRQSELRGLFADVQVGKGYLEGNFLPVREAEDPSIGDNLKVIEGSIPAGLRGAFLRNGPNPTRRPFKGKHHWFDGDGMLHCVMFSGAENRPTASYRGRMIRTLGRQMEEALGVEEDIFSGFCTMEYLGLAVNALAMKVLPPRAFGVAGGEGNWGDMAWWASTKNRANTSVVHHHGKCLALWEVGAPYEVRLPDVETVGPYRFRGAVDGNFSAHPKVDPVTGEMMVVSYQLMGRSQCVYRVFDRNGSLIHEIRLKELMNHVMMHDCAITKHYTLVLDMPLVYTPTELRAGGNVFKFNPDVGARIGALPRFGKEEDIRWMNVDPCFIFHTINAFERGSEVVLHCVRNPEQSVAAKELIDLEGRLHEYVLDLETGESRERCLSDFGHEIGLLTMNEALLGQHCRFFYTTAVCDRPGGRGHQNGIFNKILKFDTDDWSSPPVEHVLPEGWFTSQFAFAPRDCTQGSKRPSDLDAGVDASEDGWLVGFASDYKTGATEVVVLDAESMGVVTRLEMPLRVPYGFHAAFVPQHQLALDDGQPPSQ
ncbi:unnamed protein product [Ostreobium quekettii]|uniref:Carotenoid oxygenase n=1 Tax=Ostreobium quekettii TaxID=121088 RepID=A0A8S1IN57_9CHLO|nr:unnamed protein product [Ostreobium quekettii]